MKCLYIVSLLVLSPWACALAASTSTATLAEYYALAEKNYKPLKLAQEDISVAGWKLTETSRNLLPSLNVKAEETTGEADRTLGTPRFKEQSYGLQMNYSLFEGGKSWYTRKQARSNYDISRIRRTKTRQEMVFNVHESYWNLVRIRRNMDGYSQALEEIRQIMKRSRALFKEGVVAQRELLSLESEYNDAVYQAETAKADLESHSWKLADALGLDKPPENLPDAEIPFREVAVSLEECLAEAERSNSDFAIQKESLSAARYGSAVKRGSLWPRIDLNGFYGKSGSAYESEELKLGDDFQVGVQLTQFFLFNTLSGSSMRQKTAPKIGQSSRTEMETTSASFAFFDGYKQFSEKKEAEFSSRQAQYNLDKARISVNQEVRDAYFNCKKAAAQVKNTGLELSLAEKELAIVRINMGKDSSGVADVAQAVNKLASAKAAYNEAKVFYLLSLSSINKAIGVEGKYTIDK